MSSSPDAVASFADTGNRFAGRRAVHRAAWVLVLLVLVGSTGCKTRESAQREAVFRRVTAPVAFEMMHDFPGLPVLDLRPAEDFHGPAGHIRGALNAPMAALPELIRDLSFLREETFLIYCSRDECAPRPSTTCGSRASRTPC